MINSFLSVDPERRPTFESLEDDEWWNEKDITQSELEEYMMSKAEIMFEDSPIIEIRKNILKEKIEEEETAEYMMEE